MRWSRVAIACGALVGALALVAPASASTTTRYHATFVENGAGQTVCAPGTSCGSATISGLGHVAFQSVVFGACGENCHVRTIAFGDGTLVMQESVVGQVFAGANAPLFLKITQTIVGGTGRFAGATGGGSGRVNLAAPGIVTASGTITLP